MSNTLNRRFFLAGATALAGSAVLAGSTVLASEVATAGPARAIGSSAPLQSQPSLVYGPTPGIAKLDANENPYGPSTGALKAISEAAARSAYYVGESVRRLKAMIAERHDLTPEHIGLSAGSSGVLTYLAVTASKTGKILGPDLFWDTTAQAAVRQGGELQRLPRTEDLHIDLDAMYAAIDDSISLVHITNPNNPTGLVLDASALTAFCIKASKKATVLIDEAYNELTEKPEFNSMVPLIKQGHDVVVARTFSKIYGMAGMRVGYMIASPERLELANRFGLGDYAMNQAGVAAAIASYNDETFLSYSKSRIVEAREMIVATARASGLRPLPSETNFVFIDLANRNAEAFREKMAGRSVLIRGIYRDYTQWSRVSMGLMQDVEKYVAALPAVLDELPV